MKKTLLVIIAFAATICAAKAQGTYIRQKMDHFAHLTIPAGKIIFLGDSITDFGDWNELFGNNDIYNRGISGDQTVWALQRLDRIKESKPRKVFIMIGTNDLAVDRSPEDVANNIGRIVKELKTSSPETEIYVESLFPVNGVDFVGKASKKSHWEKGDEIIATNRLLEKVCANEGATYIDIYPHLVDDRGLLNPAYTNDGLHLMYDGYAKWVSILKPYME